MEAGDVAAMAVVALMAFGLWLTTTALLIWGERRVVAKMQTRVGPNRLGPLGVLQTLADGIKMFFKEDITPRYADKPTYFAAPAISVLSALLMFAVVPFGGTVEIAGREITLQVWDPEIGLLWVFAMSSIGVYGIVLAGWSSGSKYPLLGGVRSSAQMISYELGMGLSFAAVFVYVGSLQVSDIVAAQEGTLATLGPLTIPAWNIIPMLPAFAIFFVTAIAETQRPPFDLPEGEGELVGGFNTEYTGAKFAMIMLGEFMNVVTFSAVMVTLFFGGPQGPLFGPGWLQAVLPSFYFLAKLAGFLFVFVWLRGTLPRFRYDRLMDLGWKVLLPFGLVWVMASGVIVVVQDTVEQAILFRLAAVAVGAAVVLLVVVPAVARALGRDEEPGEPPSDVETGDAPDRERTQT